MVQTQNTQLGYSMSMVNVRQAFFKRSLLTNQSSTNCQTVASQSLLNFLVIAPYLQSIATQSQNGWTSRQYLWTVIAHNSPNGPQMVGDLSSNDLQPKRCTMGLLPDTLNCVLRMPGNAGNVFPATDFKGNR